MVEYTANKGHNFTGSGQEMAWFGASGLLRLLQPADNTGHNGQEAMQNFAESMANTMLIVLA
jgi:hypothetical protein